MQRTFLCPHCEKKYPVLPTLVGRKVRCTSCKSVFQLQYDGFAKKVGERSQARRQETSALEAKDQNSQASEVSLSTGVARKAAAAPRPQTRAIKRKTERIRQIRSSLQNAADSAIGSTANTVQQQELPAASSRAAAPAPSSMVVLTNQGERESRMRLLSLFAGTVLLALFAALFFMQSTGPERHALDTFCGPLTDEQRPYPHRMPAYRQRMWLYTRDGREQPPIILNADDADCTQPMRIDWTSVVSACAPVLEGLEKNTAFAMWHEIGRAADIEGVWAKHPSNQHIEEFYQTLRDERIVFLRYETLQQRLFEKGLPKAAVYVASLFLAGTRDAAGRPCRDMGLQNGLMPEVLYVSTFAQQDPHILIDAKGGYRFSSGRHFCGLIAGFTGFPGRPDEWRVLDFRLAEDIEAFYTKEHNPLRLAAKVVHEKMSEALLERRRREARERR